MEFSDIHHIDPVELNDIKADLFITSLSYESRCTNIARMLESQSCRKIALTRNNHLKEYSFRNNLEYYNQKDFEIIEVDGEVPDIGRIFQNSSEKEINVIFDCTSMSQRWYYEFFRWFWESQDDFTNARLRIVYTMAGFVDEGTPGKVRKVEDFINTGTKQRNPKLALILGLGHEPNVSETIYKLIKPDLVYLFYADPSADKRFVEEVFVNNHALINATSIRNLIAYPISNGQVIYQNLINTILPLRNEYSVILIPQGPKIFSVASMLVQIGYPDTLLKYPRFKKSQVYDRYPCGDPVILDVHFDGED